MRIEGVHALVAGRASGLGAAAARRTARRRGAVTIADRNKEAGRALADELGARLAHTDVTEASVAAAVDTAAEGGELRIAVNCAGIGWAQRTASRHRPHALQPFGTVIAVSLIGTFNVLRLCAQRMLETAEPVEGERGVIVNTASVAACEGPIGQLASSASKGGVVGMTLPAARGLARGRPRDDHRARPPRHAAAGLAARGHAPGAQGLGAALGPARDARGIRAARPGIVENARLNGETIRLNGAPRMAPK